MIEDKIIGIFGLIVAAVLYFIPTFIAYENRHRNRQAREGEPPAAWVFSPPMLLQPRSGDCQ